MSIQKKSLISTLKTAKKANLAKDGFDSASVTKAPGSKALVHKAGIGKAPALKGGPIGKAPITKALAIKG
jgi:hypothetical protein